MTLDSSAIRIQRRLVNVYRGATREKIGQAYGLDIRLPPQSTYTAWRPVSPEVRGRQLALRRRERGTAHSSSSLLRIATSAISYYHSIFVEGVL
eukprot:scaffold34656_cov178-Amphora_coffeaeformis.AAC.12